MIVSLLADILKSHSRSPLNLAHCMAISPNLTNFSARFQQEIWRIRVKISIVKSSGSHVTAELPIKPV